MWAFTGLGGGYAEPAVAPEASLVPLPAGFSAVDAVTVGGADTVADSARAAAIADLFAGVERGRVGSVVYRVLPLEQAVSAHRLMDTGEVFGRIALTPSKSG